MNYKILYTEMNWHHPILFIFILSQSLLLSIPRTTSHHWAENLLWKLTIICIYMQQSPNWNRWYTMTKRSFSLWVFKLMISFWHYPVIFIQKYLRHPNNFVPKYEIVNKLKIVIAWNLKFHSLSIRVFENSLTILGYDFQNTDFETFCLNTKDVFFYYF